MLVPVVACAILTLFALLGARNAGKYWRVDFGPHPQPPPWWGYGRTLWRANLVAGPSWAAGGVCLILAGWAMILAKVGFLPMALAKPVFGAGLVGLLTFIGLGIVVAAFGRPKFLILPGLRRGPFLVGQ